jgi:hypothetical protein
MQEPCNQFESRDSGQNVEMPGNQTPCHGQFDCMTDGSTPFHFAFIVRKYWRLRNMPIHCLWHLQNKGITATLKHTASKILKAFGIRVKKTAPKPVPSEEEILNLQPGEWVEVKSEQEILSTLDENRRYKGLYFMGGMRECCGKQYRVLKRVERILLETNQELRKMKDTVLLEGAMCNGQVWYGCDRSCYYFWREAWLKRVEED